MHNESLVYLNKVYTDLQAKSCPLLSGITATSENFNQQLTFIDVDCCDCGCGCNRSDDLDGNLTFAVESTEVFVSDFNIAHPDCLSPCDVTVNGIPVDDLEFFNDRFSASTNALMTSISNCSCMEKGMSTSGYLLITGIQHWTAKLTIVLRGSVFGCGGCKRFKLVMTSHNCHPVDITGSSTFAAPKICLPCTTNGIAPVINFSFDATAALLNPVITSEPSCDKPCNVKVTGCLIVEPNVNVQVTRATLFRTNSQVINIPCDDASKCRDASGICNPCDEDDDSNALHLRQQCCRDNIQHDWDSDEDCDCHWDCDCRREREDRREERCEDRCEDRCSRENERNQNRNNGRNRNRDICCQFNGNNGCSF